jgi:nucleoside-diphosphate-sugar epimerase
MAVKHRTREKEHHMRVLLAGASGAIGSRLIPQLIEAGHEVIGTHVRPASAAKVQALGATPLALDLLDPPAVHSAMREWTPEAVLHEATALADVRFGRNFDSAFEQTNRLRREGTDTLLAAARETGVRRFIAQSFASYRYRGGRGLKTEVDPLDPAPPGRMAGSSAAMSHLEQAVVAAGGLVLRYGGFYGAANDGLIEPVRKRQFPIVGDGAGVLCLIHLDDAAAATVLALDHGEPGIYNVVDDDPAPVRDWLPAYAAALGAKPPRHVPRWLARIVAGETAVVMGTEASGVSNAKAKRELGWTPRYPSWRTGFAAAYGPATEAVGPGRTARPRSSGVPG